jgi:hypothetical protein
MSERRMAGEARLSWRQQQVLRRLGEVVAQIKAHGTEEEKTMLTSLGALWKPGAGATHWTSSQRSSCSRSLRRLAGRGLVVRRNRRGSPVRGTTHISLSPEGEAVVRWLAARARRDVNHIFRQLERRRRALVRRRRRKPSCN